MTGRGDGRFYHPSKNPTVTIGITLSTSSPTLDPTSDTPFYLLVIGRILSTTQPSSAITLIANLNPFGPLPSRSFTDIICVDPPSQKEKRIEIQRKNWPHYYYQARDMKDELGFITVPASGTVVIKHEVPRELIAKAKVEKGERYRVAFTHVYLGAPFWIFGDLQDERVKNAAFLRRRYDEPEDAEKEGTDEEGPWIKSEKWNDLALVIEGENDSAVEFEII